MPKILSEENIKKIKNKECPDCGSTNLSRKGNDLPYYLVCECGSVFKLDWPGLPEKLER